MTTMRVARDPDAASGCQRGAAFLILAMIALPVPAQNAPAPLVWMRVEPPQADSQPADAPVAAAAGSAERPSPAARALHPARRNTHYDAMIDATARQFGLDSALLHAMIETESRYDAGALSPKGAVGLMQVMPRTGRYFGFVDLADPYSNLQAGATYLKWLLKIFDNNLELAVAGYNAGEGAVIKSGGRIPPYRETQRYVSKVLARYQSRDKSSPPTASGSGWYRSETVRLRPLPVAVLGKLAGLLLSSPRLPTPSSR